MSIKQDWKAKLYRGIAEFGHQEQLGQKLSRAVKYVQKIICPDLGLVHAVKMSVQTGFA